jgi:hypothetical protein
MHVDICLQKDSMVCGVQCNAHLAQHIAPADMCTCVYIICVMYMRYTVDRLLNYCKRTSSILCATAIAFLQDSLFGQCSAAIVIIITL